MGRIMVGKNLDAETQLRDITVRKRSCERNVTLIICDEKQLGIVTEAKSDMREWMPC